MPDKYLSQSEWKAASKRTAWQADALTRALAAFEKAEKENAAAALAALEEVEKQAGVLSKAHKGDKALSAFLDPLGKASAKRRGELQKDAGAVRNAAGSRDDDDENASDDALVDPKRLQAQLNLLRRDPARRVNFATVDGKDDKDPLFVLSPKVAGKKLWTKLQELSGVKVGSYGMAWIDEQTLILQVDNKPLSGLAKKVRIPIKGCGFKAAKVVLWDAQGGMLEEAADEAASADAAAMAAPSATDALRARFEQRLAELAPRVDAAQGDVVAKLRQLLSFARAKAQAAQFAPALQALDALQGLLGAAPAAAGAAAPTDGGVPPRSDYARSSRAWTVTRTKVAEDVGRLRNAILAEFKDSPLLPEISSKVGRLDAMVARFDDKLSGLLDRAQGAADEAERVRLHREAAASIRRTLAQLDSDPILGRLHDNPFLPIDPRAALNATLQALATQVP